MVIPEAPEASPNPEENYELMVTPEAPEASPNPEENYELMVTPEAPESQPSKRRKKKSIVWEYFTIENVSAGTRRAYCKQCRQSFAYSIGSKVAGTSHLKRHIAKGSCPSLLRNNNHENHQMTPLSAPAKVGGDPPKRRYRTAASQFVPFDQDRTRHEIARMIVLHDYPLHMVEHQGFVSFVQNLQPRFELVNFSGVQGDCIASYLSEKQGVMKFIEGMPGRVCITVDSWTSSQSMGYLFMTGYFMDIDWKIHRRLLNVVMEPFPDSDNALRHAVATCLSEWGLESKLFSLTFNQPLSEGARENLRQFLAIKNPLILNGQLLIGSCIARVLTETAKDVLVAGQEVIKKIRDNVKYVKTSELHEEKFVYLRNQLHNPSDKSLSLDDQTQWNTTYEMLAAASELKEVFPCLDSDSDYRGAPSKEEWEQVETLCNYLKPLYDAGSALTSPTNASAIMMFHEVWKIQSDLSKAATGEDPFLAALTKPMLKKIDKYWKDCSLVLAIAVVMDPRFKMKLVEFSFSKMYSEDAPTYIKIVDDGIHELFLEYVSLPLPLTPTYAEDGMRTDDPSYQGGGGTLLSDHGLTDFDVYIMETSGQQMKSELDQYLDESLLPRVQEFDVLGWWKLNKLKYPTLSKMARDILLIPVSTLTPESVFDTTSREMDQYRSSLRPETVDALFCTKDWLQYGSAGGGGAAPPAANEVSNALVKMEFPG